ncbi:MAG: hypothetical protein JXX14_15530 [Deltaproteobacteria bacterium]|nr:hypothetical protein [Deltaproteobacteria bacterium]
MKSGAFPTAFVVAVMLIISTVSSGNTSGQPDDILVIVNKSSAITSIDITDVRRLFLKQKSSVKGVSVVVINAPESSQLRAKFVQKVFDRTVKDENAYWEAQKIKIGLRKPFELSNTIRAVFSKKDSVSYCFRRDFNPLSARVVLTIQ